VAIAKLPKILRWAATYMTGSELWGRALTEEEVNQCLGKISVFDLLRAVGALSVDLAVHPQSESPQRQAELVAMATIEQSDLQRKLLAGLAQARIAIFTQQLYHVARLALLFADRRAPDNFENGQLLDEFRSALFGVTDHFYAGVESDGAIRSLELQLAAINRNEDRMLLWSFYYELLYKIWPSIDKAPNVEEAFQRYTKLSIEEYLALGFALSAGFSRDSNGRYPGAISAEQWLSKLIIGDDKIEAYLAATAGTPDELRDGLLQEERNFGPTVVGSLEIEKRPIIRGPDALFVSNFGAFERRGTHGIFHILSEGAQGEGKDRETYTAPFGEAFQGWVEQTIRRTEASKEVEIFADIPYGTKSERRDTPDVVLAYERNVVAIEVVAGAMRIQSLTRGDLTTFAADLEKLIFKKATQLTKRIRDMREGLTDEIGLKVDKETMVWPVIVTFAPFPHRPQIVETLRQELKKRNLLQERRVGTLGIIDAEEVLAIESFVTETDSSVLEVLRGWKSRAQTGDMYLKNYLYEQLGRPLPHTEHARAMFDEATNRIFPLLFNEAPPAE
jgi:hypothetical protein